MADYTFQAEGGNVALTPYVMARTAHHFFAMSEGYDTGPEIPFARHYLYCASIEIGLKAAILANECTVVTKADVKNFGHDLAKAWAAFQDIYGSELWNSDDIAAVTAISPFFVSKGLEYFTIDVLVDTVNGARSLPDIVLIGVAAKKVDAFVAGRGFFNS